MCGQRAPLHAHSHARSSTPSASRERDDDDALGDASVHLETVERAGRASGCVASRTTDERARGKAGAASSSEGGRVDGGDASL